MRALLLLGIGLVSSSAFADASPYLGRDNPLGFVLPSAPSLQARERERLEAQLTRLLTRLPGAAYAEVALTFPDASHVALDQPLPAPSARVLLQTLGAGPSDAQVLAVLRAALPELSPYGARIVRAVVPATRAPERRSDLVQVGPFNVSRESSALLRASLAACLGANVLLAALLLARLRAR